MLHVITGLEPVIQTHRALSMSRWIARSRRGDESGKAALKIHSTVI